MAYQEIELGKVCDFVRGLTYKKADEVELSSNAILRANNISLETGKLNLDEIKYIRDDIDITAKKMVQKNSLLICTASGSKKHLGKIAYIDKDYPYAFGGFMGLLSPKDMLHAKYLYWVTQSKSYSDYIMALSDGANINNLKFSQLSQFKISLPSLTEQKRIVAILDEAFAGIDQAIANTEKNLASARELFESYLNTIFTQKGEGWEEYSLNDICEITAKLVDPREDEFLDLPHLGAGNMISQSDELIEVKTAREEGLISGKFVFEKGVVLYSKIRPYLMKVCRPDFKGLCSADVYPLMPIKNKLDRDFLFYLLLSKHFTEYAIKGSARAGMPKVNRTHLFKYMTHIPSIAKQKELAVKIDKAYSTSKHLEKIFSEKLANLNELKQSLLQKAFSGELTANMSDEIAEAAE